MKKVLFATTALVATAGVAAADVTFGGYGRVGVLYNENATGTDETNVTSRFRLQIDATAESDMGVTFGARARIQQNNTDNTPTYSVGPDNTAGTADDINGASGPSGTGINGVRFFARSGGLEVGVGNIFGALEFMPGMYPIDLGLTGLGYDYTAFNFRGDAYSSGGNGAAGSNGVEVLYSMGDLSVHVSASDTNNRVAAFAAYTFSGYTVALGLQDSDSASDTEVAFSVGGNVGPAALTFAYAKNGDDTGVGTTTGDHYVLAAKFDVGAATDVEVYVADADYFTDTSYGVDFNHDLGGGTSLRGGVASRGNGFVRADLGVRFNF
ncbi:porin [Sulfitobacter sp.]|uniref:porin n=1 Tax=Sulfitobacter sp. TaxID=1903071 RepID=UPI00356485D7